MCPHLRAHLYVCAHACVCGRVSFQGLHTVEGAALELLIERDTAQVSMLHRAEAGLWWAVKSSRGLRTTRMCVCIRACTYVMHACVGKPLLVHLHTVG